MCYVKDPSSQANTAQVATSHLHIAVAADFNVKILRGSVVLSLAALEDGVSEVILDTNHLEVSGAALVQESGHEQPLQYQLGPVHPAFGSALSVKLPSALAKGSAFKVRVHYATTTDSGALQFLAPEQTVGKKHPYLFTQCQAIHARSLVPCADSPSQKLTYSAEITAPAP
ncbi:leukotriene A4 hydrolase N-terminal domain-containing protein, partial [Ramicandelaber brevisporus]